MLQLLIDPCSAEEVPKLCDQLEEIGAIAITMTDKQDDAIFEPEWGTMPLWPQVIVHALYASEAQAKKSIELLATEYQHLNYALDTLPEQDWERVCMDSFKPMRFGNRLWVCPSWEEPPEPNAINLILDPGLAFGTGTHATTSLCLTWLEHAALTEKTVIDYGCGSGILALAALKLGASHVYAVDIEAQALLATQTNASRNAIRREQLSISSPEALHIPADFLIANILLSPLLTLQQRFRQLLKKTGVLIVSGILATQVESLIAAYQTDFIHQASFLEDEWAVLVFKPRDL